MSGFTTELSRQKGLRTMQCIYRLSQLILAILDHFTGLSEDYVKQWLINGLFHYKRPFICKVVQWLILCVNFGWVPKYLAKYYF